MGVTGNGYRFDDRRHDSAVVALSEPLVGEVFGKEFADKLSRSPSAGTVRHVNGAAAHIQPPSQSCTFCLEIMSHCFSPLEGFATLMGRKIRRFLNFNRAVTAVAVVRGAGAFGRYHAGSDRMRRCADRTKEPAVLGFFFTAQNGAAFTGLIVCHTDFRH